MTKLTLEQKATLLSGATTFTTREIAKYGIPSLTLADGPSGLRKQEGAADHLGLNGSVPATCFPAGATLAASWDPAVAQAVGHAIGEECQSNGVQELLGPALNIKRNPRCGRNFEYYSEDPYLAGQMAAGYIQGVQSTGTIATPKHLAVNSQELKRMASNSVVDARAERELYLTNFEIAVKAGHPHAVMSSYNMINGTYANEDAALLQTTLRDEWGFDGLVVSDWGGDNDHVAGVTAGSHLQMPSTGLEGPQVLIDAVRAGKLAQSVLDQRVIEYLRVVQAATIRAPHPTDFAGHHEVARWAAAESMVLLQNQRDVLPLSSQTRIAVIGDFAQTPRYQGAGSSAVNAKQVERFTEVAGLRLNVTGFAQGFTRVDHPDADLLEEAKSLASHADVALVFIGLNEAQESEGKDRTSLELPRNQVALLDALASLDTPVVAVLAAGGVVTMPWRKDVEGLLHTYLTGEAGASAICDVLLGEVNPSGKLAESYPLVQQDVPLDSAYPTSTRDVLYQESLYVGYRYYDKVAAPVAFPFGFGLSYTTFDYRELTVDQTGAHVTLVNTGQRTGAEVVQLYVQSPDQQLYHPVRELKGFTKIKLAPGEAQRVTIPFDAYTFRAWDPTKQVWVTPGGIYTIAVAAGSRDVRLTAQYTVAGPTPTRQLGLPHYFSGAVTEATPEEIACLIPDRAAESHDGQLTANSTIGDMHEAQSALARLVARQLQRRMAKLEAQGKSSLNLLFIYNMPIRGMAKMTNGQMDSVMVDGITQIANGHFWRGVTQVLSGWMTARRRTSQLRRLLEEQDHAD
ncbi:glycoside hydrolase family 3 C-terminal domain-containing protein [Lacticaseibacillus daqingensis]|uniref:glycoside hydrolase family 3 C-terminal domain-containing protein n=1 Tax=Lacticaseibacillus daqingensis TaxID=2486014 RepID=UPI002989AF2E|nr:glycoside hydrolase family 3 C-terminal domain-containing protein [Lacticaseibacillus daqingensis]